MSSISRRLVVSLSLPLAALFGLTVVILDSTFRHAAERALEIEMDAHADSIVPAMDLDKAGNVSIDLLAESPLLRRDSGLFAQVVDEFGTALWVSPSAAGRSITFGNSTPPSARQFDFAYDSTLGRMAILRNGYDWVDTKQRLTVTVIRTLDAYEQANSAFRSGIALAFFAIGLLLLGLLAVLTRWVLQPLRRLASEISEVEEAKRQLLSDNYPIELEPVSLNLNRLLKGERVRTARYRDTLGNLAHSLKTPLAVMRSVLPDLPTNAVGTLDHEIDRMKGIVEHQLHRAASGGKTLGQVPLPVEPVAEDLRIALLKAHSHKDLSIDIEIAPGVGFLGDRGDLLEALGNIMENAVKWCASTVRIEASLSSHIVGTQSRELKIVVGDDGRGIPLTQRMRILDRGARADEMVAGHGLGLSMVLDMVEGYGGQLIIGASSLGGASILLVLPGREILA